MHDLEERDSLTGLLNRRAFMQRLELEVARAGRYGGPLTLALCDVDIFKRVNDEYGQDSGQSRLPRDGM